ncbi:MAG: hypothetical protein LAP21_11175 [Acidobacteriia bacterium]|nr:hypothetical protein [Terriglobia bacterium]
MNRKLLWSMGALFVLVALRYALGQDDTGVGWDPPMQEDPGAYIVTVMTLSPIVGTMIAMFRIASQRSARPVLEPLRLN